MEKKRGDPTRARKVRGESAECAQLPLPSSVLGPATQAICSQISYNLFRPGTRLLEKR